VRFGLFHTVQWPAGHSQVDVYSDALREAVLAEELGLDSVWLTEHHFSRHGIISDSLAVLAHLAGLTSRIRLGTAVAVLPFHNPVRLAETAATVDVLSGGRLDFGIGRGYQWSEFAGFGVDMSERGDRFAEALDVIVRAWAVDSSVGPHGRYWQFGDVDPQPKPVQQPHPPIWVATDSADGLRRCAEQDYGVLLPQGRSLDVVADQVARYRRSLEEAGKSYDPAKVILARALYVDESDDRAWEVAGQPYLSFLERAMSLARPPDGSSAAVNPFDTEDVRDAVVFGSPTTCASQLSRIVDLGIDHVLFFIRFSELSHDRIVRSLGRFASDVAPAVRESKAVAV